MSYALDDFTAVAIALWQSVTSKFAQEWHYLYNFYYSSNFANAVIDAFTDLAVAFEYESAIAAVSAKDTAEIGRDMARHTWDALWFLRFAAIPDAGLAAERHADLVAAEDSRNVWLLAWSHILDEAGARALGDLQEHLRLDVAIAQEHADMITRVAIETNDRVTEVAQVRAQLNALVAATRASLLAYIDQQIQQVNAQIAQVSTYAHSVPGLVDKSAADGYDPTLSAHATTLTRLLDTVVAHEPLISDVVSKLAGWLVDLAEVDDPLIRLAAQLLLKQIIDRVGLDTALGRLLDALLGPVLSGGPPKTLQQVTAQVGDRLNGAETGLAALAPLGPEADQLAEMGTLAFDAGLLAYLAAAVTAPAAAADDTVAALEPVVTPLLEPVRALLGIA